MEEEVEWRKSRCKWFLIAHKSGEHHVENEQGFHPLNWSANWNWIQWHPYECWSWIPSSSCDQTCFQPKEIHYQRLDALFRGAFTLSSLSCWLRLNFFFLFFSLTLIIFNFFKKSFHILIFTKVILSNLFFVQRDKLLGFFNEGFIKKHDFDWQNRIKITLKKWPNLVTTPPIQIVPTRLSFMSHKRH